MANEQMQDYWAGGAEHWVANEPIMDAVFAPVTAAVLAAAAIGPGDRLLDIGCGSGTLLAAAAGQGAVPVGIDISPGMVQAARKRVPGAEVLVADAQTAELPGPFDRVVSRFGVMFFDDPVAAFGNVRRSTADGGRLAFACWRGRDENPTFTLGTRPLVERLGPPADQPGTPGPTALADPDRVREVLTAAGWRSVGLDPLDFDSDHRIGGSDGVEERLATILGTATGRLAAQHLKPALGPVGWAALLDEVRAELRSYRPDGTVVFPAATWIVTAAA